MVFIACAPRAHNMVKEKIIFCWSGGKDSALALNRILQDNRYQVATLLTTCNDHFQRVSMHGVRLELLEQQAEAIGLPLEKVFVSQRSSNEEYQQKMSACLLAHKVRGVTACAFGEFFALGFGSVICCTNDAYLGEDAVGRNIDAGFIAALPPEVDPCGENGEFHSFAFAGPIFKQPVKFKVGEKVYRPVEVTHPSDSSSSYVCPAGPHLTKGFWFCDLLPEKR